MSEAERSVQRRIREKAAITQQRHNAATVSKQQPGSVAQSDALPSSPSTIARADSSLPISSVPDAHKDVAGDTASKKLQQKRIRLTSSDGKQVLIFFALMMSFFYISRHLVPEKSKTMQI